MSNDDGIDFDEVERWLRIEAEKDRAHPDTPAQWAKDLMALAKDFPPDSTDRKAYVSQAKRLLAIDEGDRESPSPDRNAS
jgi:hypothetical protein